MSNSSSGVLNPGASQQPVSKPPTGSTQSPAVSGAQAKTPPKKKIAPTWRQKWESRDSNKLQEITTALPGLLTSLAIHLVVLMLLAMIVIPQKDREEFFNALVAKTEKPIEEPPLEDFEVLPEELESNESESNEQEVQSEIIAETPNPVELDVNDLDLATDVEVEDAVGPDIKIDSQLGGRSQAARSALLKSQGGSAASEAAVTSGLKWLAQHQLPNGAWSFQHGDDDPGTLKNDMGATGLALLAFLGAGHTHQKGEYEKTVMGGLTFLTNNMQIVPAGGDLRGKVVSNEGMYVQGICTIALCEAYALSNDRRLRKPTQLAVDFIVNAQDPKGGGWRYTPQQKGDTSVVGWQIMALKSAKIAKLVVPSRTIGKATYFLNTVQTDGGAKYGYETPGAGPATSAVGLLCRMYLGWTPKQEALSKGIDFISKTGPQANNMYYSYYGTQVMHHWGGEPWKKWNEVMREHLVKSQVKDGAAMGSWPPAGGHAATGGRLYTTCLSIMTLEVYYRHLPLYQRQTITTEF